jgi:hypothetical protein
LGGIENQQFEDRSGDIAEPFFRRRPDLRSDAYIFDLLGNVGFSLSPPLRVIPYRAERLKWD